MTLNENELPATGIQLPDRYQVKETLADLPVTVVLLAHDDVLDREVVLKYPGPVFDSADAGWRRTQILEEARSLARLRHPQLNGILDVVDVPGGPLLVLEPVIGEPLLERIAREGPLPIDDVVRVGAELADAIATANAEGVLHRALTTRCVLVDTAGHPVVTGFHFAASARDGTPLPDAGAEAVPPSAAPEIQAGRAADARSEVFSIGWVVFECLTGQPPFVDGAKVARDATELRPDTPRALASVLARALSGSPLKRFEDAASLASAFRALVSDSADAAPSATPPLPALRLVLPIAGAVAAALVAVLALQNMTDRPADAQSRGMGNARVEASDTAAGLQPFYTNSYALLIGVGEAYEEPFKDLPNAERDVAELREMLEKHDEIDRWQIETLLGEEVTADALVDKLAELSDRTQPDDRVFIYFAGHGKKHDRAIDSAWLIPADAVEGSPSTWVRFDELAKFFPEARAKHVLVALDCCYGGTLATTRGTGDTRFNERYLRSRAHVVLASGRPNEMVLDGALGGNSPFAGAFIDALGGKGEITSTAIYLQIEDAFREAGVPHVPQHGPPLGSPIGGEFVFYRR